MQLPPRTKPDPNLLVVGYGNTLRQDDGVGPRVAARIADLALPGVATIECTQLSPEHTEHIAAARSVVFVDATAIRRTGIELAMVAPAESAQVTTHELEPGTILALARDVFGRTPRAWSVTIPAIRLGFGEDLSPEAERGIEAAVGQIVRLVQPTGFRPA